jgi:hypothetical protein
MAPSFVPGPIFTAVVTVPLSVGCKVFVWCCKRSKLAWGSAKYQFILMNLENWG